MKTTPQIDPAPPYRCPGLLHVRLEVQVGMLRDALTPDDALKAAFLALGYLQDITAAIPVNPPAEPLSPGRD